MGCACLNDRNSEELPKISHSRQASQKGLSASSKTAAKLQPTNFDTPNANSSAQIQPLDAGYNVLSAYRLGNRKGLFLGELKNTKKRCVVHAVPLREETKKACSRSALKDAYTQLNHPHIRQFYGSMRDAASLYVVFESCEGGEMTNMLEDKQPFSELQVGMIIKQLLSVLNYLHQREMCHGKIHPDFIGFKSFSDGDVMTKLAGFFAYQWDRERPLSVYDAPELATQQATFKSDIWSCGVLLYRLLMGKLPYPKHAWVGAPLFDTNQCSSEVVSLIREMLSSNPENRPSALALLTQPWLMRWSQANMSSINFRKNISRMTEIRSVSPLGCAFYRIIIDNLAPTDKTSEVAQMFMTMDTDHDGILHKEDVLSCLRLLMSEANAQRSISNIMLSFDKNEDGIDYSEFQEVMLRKDIVLSDNLLAKVFRLFTTEEQRSFPVEMLRKRIGVKKTGQWLDLLKELGIRPDGEIEREVFKKLVKRATSRIA
jgi:serine/threonine protein kinase